jgi:hypothetical protein
LVSKLLLEPAKSKSKRPSFLRQGGGKPADPRRSAAHRSQHRQAVPELLRRNG